MFLLDALRGAPDENHSLFARARKDASSAAFREAMACVERMKGEVLTLLPGLDLRKTENRQLFHVRPRRIASEQKSVVSGPEQEALVAQRLTMRSAR